MTDKTTQGLVGREAIARIIDPEAWKKRADFILRKTGEGWRVGPEVWQQRADDAVAPSLAKADEIIALRSNTEDQTNG